MDDAEQVEVVSPMTGTVAHLPAAVGSEVRAGDAIVFIEAMKMEHRVTAEHDGEVVAVTVALGDEVSPGDHLATIAVAASVAPRDAVADEARPASDPPARADLDAVRDRHARTRDEHRPDAVARRHARGHRTARENVLDLLDPDSFVEQGALAIAAQRRRRGVEELLDTTPADGLVCGIGTVDADVFGEDASRVAVAAYDYTVLAGTQGFTNHHKKDRLFRMAEELGLPVVVFAEGGGGRPGDTDVTGGSWLDAEAFHLFARLSGTVPLVAIVNGRCFAGNAALAGCADLIIATEGSTLGMAGPAMIEGGGLGRVTPDEIGPVAVQSANGVIDVVVADEAEAVAVARRYLGLMRGRTAGAVAHDQVPLREAVPENRKRVYDVRAIIDRLFDVDSVLELRRGFAPGMVTALARLDGRPVGVLANDPAHLGGAIDADGADAAARLLQLCDGHALPIVALCDTPGFMVGPEAEHEGGVRHFSRMFVTGANLRVPLVTVITRKAYGLGAQAMMGGHLRVPISTIGWPTSELGPMGLEGAVRLGFRRELDAIEDAEERARREAEMIAAAHDHAAGLNVATYAEIDDVIDPADTRDRIAAALSAAANRPRRRRRPFIDTW